jgi:hypothetical protein
MLETFGGGGVRGISISIWKKLSLNHGRNNKEAIMVGHRHIPLGLDFHLFQNQVLTVAKKSTVNRFVTPCGLIGG